MQNFYIIHNINKSIFLSNIIISDLSHIIYILSRTKWIPRTAPIYYHFHFQDKWEKFFIIVVGVVVNNIETKYFEVWRLVYWLYISSSSWWDLRLLICFKIKCSDLHETVDIKYSVTKLITTYSALLILEILAAENIENSPLSVPPFEHYSWDAYSFFFFDNRIKKRAKW
jgi:hypothetical protein